MAAPRLFHALGLALLSLPALAQDSAAVDAVDLAYYLPQGTRYQAQVPKPADVLGYQVGTWHVRHDQIVQYFRTLAEASPRMVLETYGRTYEGRELLLAAVSSPENLAKLEELRAAHVAAVRSGAEDHDGPQVVWMGYSVHGNESSGANASLLFAYHLAAAQGKDIDTLLRDTIILIDPCLNPDGLSRFAQWANNNKGLQLVDDPSHRERREAWPGGRTNHYWFDLNRDWLLLTHPESRGRLTQFHRWLPSVLTDYHEMGSDSTYFFQPGIPSRQNPLTPDENLELTRGIAEFHADALDAIGSLYYTEESFDDFYYGKGSTYPDINGCIGILFEQASSRGHLQENSFGGISFPFTIRNQLVTSLSTIRAAHALRASLTGYQRAFYRSAREEAARHPVRAYVFAAPEDPGRTLTLVDLLRRHDVQVHRLGAPLEGFDPASAFVVPLDQPQFRLIRAVFETRTSWPDNTFYDVSSWTLPLSFDVPYRGVELAEFRAAHVGAEVSSTVVPAGKLERANRPVAYLFEWQHQAAPEHLGRLLRAGVRARVATRAFRAETAGGPYDFSLGTIVIAAGAQEVAPQTLQKLLADAAADGLTIRAATSGLTPVGVDLGSGSLAALEAPRPMLVVGSGVSGYEAGEVWHHFDQRLKLPLPLIEKDDLEGVDLGRYSHLILVNGASSGWDEDLVARVRAWVRAGGVLIATKGSATWAAGEFLSAADEEQEQEEPDTARLTYGEYEQLRAESRVAGTIFEVELDLTHPLCFGFTRDRLPVFKNSTAVLPPGNDPFAAPARYSEAPLVSGFASEENVGNIAGSPAVRAGRVGRGAVICLVDNPIFRGVWHGTNKFLANALFFAGAIKRTGPLSDEVEEALDSHGHAHGELDELDH